MPTRTSQYPYRHRALRRLILSYVAHHHILACPFCRELYGDDEVEVCPECDVLLRPLCDLPPSYEVREAEAAEWERTPPQDRLLPWHYFQRGRGVLLALALLGLGCSFAPWIELVKPQTVTLSGWDLATTRGFWFGGALASWLVMLPLVFSRRTITKMRGIRIILCLFSVTPTVQSLMLGLNAPTSELVPVEYHWGWGFYATALLGMVALPFAARFGGRVDDLPADLGRELAPNAEPTTSAGHTLH